MTYTIPTEPDRIRERIGDVDYLHRAGYTALRIAHTLNIPVANVRSRIYRIEAKR